jgi:hypothetical protein
MVLAPIIWQSLIGTENGCRFTLDDTQVIFGGKTINLVIESFTSEMAAALVANKRVKGDDFPLGIVFTENMEDRNVMAGDFISRQKKFARSKSSGFHLIFHPRD